MTETLVPAPGRMPTRQFITPYSKESSLGRISHLYGFSGAGSNNVNYPGVNSAFYYPFTLQYPMLVDKAFVLNGALVAGNFDIGVYDSAASPNLLGSTGATAQTGAGVIQEVNVDWRIGPGNLYLAFASNTTTNAQYWRIASTAQQMMQVGVAQQASAYPLPATATLVTIATAWVHLFGISARSLVA